MAAAAAQNSPTDNVFSIPKGQMRETTNQLARQFANQSPTPGTAIQLDLRSVDFVGSEDLGALVILNKRLRAAGAQLSLLNVQPVVSQVLSLTRLDTILKVQNTLVA
jgi:anti-anti-sigma factor